MAYDIHPSVDEGYNFPPQVRQSIAASTEIKATVENTMGEVVDDLVADAIANDATIKQAAKDAVEPVLLSTNVVRAYPEGPVQQTSKSEIPMWWTYKTLNDPYDGYYSDTYEGTWSGSLPVRGNVPILDVDDLLHVEHFPKEVVKRRDLLGLLPPIQNAGDISELIRLRVEDVISPDLPIFAARNAAAKALEQPLAVVIEGSSTSWYNPGYVRKLTSKLQNAYIVESDTKAQWNADHNFISYTAPGMHVYNGAQSGSSSATYLTQSEIQKVAPMKPALMIHMVGSNDFKLQMPIADYKANLQQRITWANELFELPCQHLLILPYERMDNASATIPWLAYGAAMKELANSNPNVVYRDISDAYRSVGVPGSDPLDLITNDLVHQTASGNEFLADLMTSIILNSGEHTTSTTNIGAWVPVPLRSGYLQQGSYINECRIEPDGIHYRGGIVGANLTADVNHTIGDVPVGFRPSMSRYSVGVSNTPAVVPRVVVNSGGQLGISVSGPVNYVVYDFKLAI